MALWVDNAGLTLCDDDDVGLAGMVDNDVACGVPSDKVAYPRLRCCG